MRLELKFRKLHYDAIIPTKAHDGDLGWDLYALEDTLLEAESGTLVSTGIACNFPGGVGAILKDRSSVASKERLYVKAGVIDNGYIGEIKVLLENPRTRPDVHHIHIGDEVDWGSRTIKRGQKIAQMILVPIIDCDAREVDFLDETVRGDKGFGSSGR